MRLTCWRALGAGASMRSAPTSAVVGTVTWDEEDMVAVLRCETGEKRMRVGEGRVVGEAGVSFGGSLRRWGEGGRLGQPWRRNDDGREAHTGCVREKEEGNEGEEMEWRRATLRRNE